MVAGDLHRNGPALYYEHTGQAKFPYPYVFHIAASNPFRAAFKERELRIILDDAQVNPDEKRRLVEMRKNVGNSLWGWFDIDLLTGKTVETTATEEMANRAEEAGNIEEAARLRKELEGYESVRDIAMASGNRTERLFKEVRSRLELFVPRFELGGPSSPALLHDPEFLRENTIRHIGYFGLMSEAVYERLAYEFRNARGGDGPVIGDLGGDPLRLASEPSFFHAFMNLMNYQHDCQVAYGDGEDGEPPSGN